MSSRAGGKHGSVSMKKNAIQIAFSIITILAVSLVMSACGENGDETDLTTGNSVETRPDTKTTTTTEKESVPYASLDQDDPNCLLGQPEHVLRVGVNGEKTITYQVITEDGKQKTKKKTSEEITIPPVNEVIGICNYVPPPPPPAPSPSCDPNYSGCVPIDSDVDCAGGSGNGPSYANGPVSVIGYDIYGLDGDGDGVGCE